MFAIECPFDENGNLFQPIDALAIYYFLRNLKIGK